jgi:hypothetical protein
MRQWQNYFPGTKTRTRSWRSSTKLIKTEILLHLNLGIFFILCLSNVCLAYHWLVYFLSLFISLGLYFFFCVCVFVFLFLYLLCFPSPLTLPIQISPLLLLQARKYWITHSTGTVTIARAIMGRWKKEGNHFPPNNKLVQEPEWNEGSRYPDSDSNKMKIN